MSKSLDEYYPAPIPALRPAPSKERQLLGEVHTRNRARSFSFYRTEQGGALYLELATKGHLGIEKSIRLPPFAVDALRLALEKFAVSK